MSPGNQGPWASFGCRLRRLREQAGLSQRDLAIAVGVTAQMVYRWERAGVIPTAARLPQLAATLRAPPDALFGQAAHDVGERPAESEAAAPASLRALREAAGLSQWQLAVRLGVTEGVVSRWEAGDRQPNARYLADLARLIGAGSVDTVLAALTAPPAARDPHADRAANDP
ncbi:MAG: helix-turn-helix domain-containing protein [Chloroflexota bacterium]|nr:helix-turn-helix domain-containing protein [Chloroflexota bacterium]